ncbi:MAG TPA: thioredoxin domain-containing protein [Candidatus Acidoferrales bacterium]
MKFRIVLALAVILNFEVAARGQTPPAAPSSSDQAHLSATIESFLRNLFSWGLDFQVKLGPYKDATIPGYYEVGIEVKYKDQDQRGVVYASKDGAYLIRGELYKTSEDPFASVRKDLSAKGSPSKGPSDSKITLVEFSDFECPHCRQLHEYLKTLEQKYPQVRIVFKNYPIEAIHPWAMTAAIAGHCAYETSSDAFWKMEAAIFDQQDLISAENAYEKLTDAAVAAGLQRDTFRACLADPAAKEVVQVDLAAGQKLGVNSTPTVFVNGREAIGGDASAVEQLIDYELHTKL